ncbi:unnamed protein product [Paramecium octaurelia]|uniref:Protein kinase domain-containing protein n=1 Tax=Paramecium octaurelia TaxID=43137 RepID=A0A8S1VP11_PAROT|nr:unnamed protein product [Paramecium octaurelia]
MSVPKINQLQFWKSVNDIRYGEIKVYKLNDGHAVAVKDHIFQDEEQWHHFREQAELQMQSRQKDLFLIEMLDLQFITEKELCTQMTQAHSVYEYFDEYLERLIVEQAASKQHFEEIEIAAMLHCTLVAIQKLSIQQKSHGDIRPLTISVTSFPKNCPIRQNEPYPIYKLTDIQQLTDLNAFKRCVTKQLGNYNLSPEQLQFLKQKVLRPTYDLNKSDVFSIGLTALQMAILKNINDIYDYTHYLLSTEKLDAYIREMKTLYSEQLCSIVCQLLQLAPENRPNSRQANDLLIGYRFQLEDYFRQSTIQENLPNYSIDFRQQISNQKFEQQVVSRVVDTTDIYEQLELLEQRTKIALQRSQDAQNKCQKTPSKQLDQTRSCQLYNNLTPITQQELQLQLSDCKQDNINQQSNYQNQQNYYPKHEINQFQIQEHEQYQYNQQEIEDKPKQNVVEQLHPTNLQVIESRPITYNETTNKQQQQLIESINTDQTKSYQYSQQYQNQSKYQQEQYSQQYQNHSKYQQQPRQSQLLRDQELTKQLTGQQEALLTYQLEQENHLQSPYSSKQDIHHPISQHFDSKNQVGVRLSGTQAQVQRQLTGSIVETRRSNDQLQ